MLAFNPHCIVFGLMDALLREFRRPSPVSLEDRQFILCFLGLSILAWVGTVMVFRLMAKAFATAVSVSPLTDPYEIALLTGGPRRMLEAALASLLAQGLILVHRESSGKTTTFSSGVDLSGRCLHPFERAVVEQMPGNLSQLRNALPEFERLYRNGLISKGLMFSYGKHAVMRFFGAFPLFALLIYGAYRLLDRKFLDYNIENVWVENWIGLFSSLIVIHAFAVVSILRRTSYATIAGESFRERFHKQVFAPRLGFDVDRGPGLGVLAATAVAVAGTEALLSSGYESLKQVFTSDESVDSSDSGFYESDVWRDVPDDSSDD